MVMNSTANSVALLIEAVRETVDRDPERTAFTFFDYSTDRSGRPEAVSYRELDARALAVARELREITGAGARAAILCPQGPHYVVALLGCLYAGVIAVPLYPPDSQRTAERLAPTLADCLPEVIITTEPFAGGTEELLRLPQMAAALPKELLLADQIEVGRGSGVRPVTVAPDDIAYLQYTSGSTRTPVGVEVRYRNIAVGVAQLSGCMDITPADARMVSWLPFFHDMGLVMTILLPLTLGVHVDHMTPFAFIQQPRRWLRLLGERGGTHTAVPNFALDLCVERVGPDQRAGLDLSSLRVLSNGSEPVRAATLERFSAAFAPYGFDPAAHAPGYGLAEATLMVCAAARPRPPTVGVVDRAALGRKRVVWSSADDADGHAVVGCGVPYDQEVLIVEPETGRMAPPDGIGEIWVRGDNVCAGYWRRPERSAEVFGAVPADGRGNGAGGWLRTGDLGFLHDGQLYITGRLKDLVIVDGRNHYPADLEFTAEQASPVVRRGHVAAFSLDTGESERLVLVAEVNGRAEAAAAEEARRSIRGAVLDRHAVDAHDVLLVRRGALPKTTSGKLQRGACRERYLRGDLPAARGSESS
jgi:acyl-CoA synthetase (AMP-forming)/AMP-acid ligase II